jgi:hypothetical protein
MACCAQQASTVARQDTSLTAAQVVGNSLLASNSFIYFNIGSE